VGCGPVRCGEQWSGNERQEASGKVWIGKVRQRMAGLVRLGGDGYGEVR